MSIKQKAYAKINLGMDVTGKRSDGYHMVKMVMQTIDLCDELEFTINNSGKIAISTASRKIPCDEHNLIWKVCNLIKDKYGICEGVNIELKKNIPVAAGMAGGSADAAAAFRGMNELFGLNMSVEEMREMSVKLGADIPFCISGGTVLCEGIGEELTKLREMPKCFILIAKPAIAVSTPWVYSELDKSGDYSHPDIDGMCKDIAEENLNGIASKLGNVLETVTVKKFTVIDEIKKMMTDNGAIGSMMSGSGPTVFGIFTDAKKFNDAYDEIKKAGIAPELFKSQPVQP